MNAGMIGRIELPGGVGAALGGDGRWSSGDAAVAAHLNWRFDPRRPTGVACVLPFGHGALAQAAAALKGRAVFAGPPAPLPPGAVS
jgi:hypothetical protein